MVDLHHSTTTTVSNTVNTNTTNNTTNNTTTTTSTNNNNNSNHVNEWHKIKELWNKQQFELEQLFSSSSITTTTSNAGAIGVTGVAGGVNNHLIHPLLLQENIYERKQTFKHAIDSMRMKFINHFQQLQQSSQQSSQSQGVNNVTTGGGVINTQNLDKQNKSLKEYKKLNLQEKEILSSLQNYCQYMTENNLQNNLQKNIKRILINVCKEMNELLGKEEYVFIELDDDNHHLDHSLQSTLQNNNLDTLQNNDIIYSIGSEQINLDITFHKFNKKFVNVSFQKLLNNKEVKVISEDLLKCLKNSLDLFEKKLIAVCKLYYLFNSRPNCMVTDLNALRDVPSNITTTTGHATSGGANNNNKKKKKDYLLNNEYLKSASVMREIEKFIVKENNFKEPSFKISRKCEGVWIQYYKENTFIVTLEGCGGNALNQTCPVMKCYPNKILLPFYLAKKLDYLPKMFSSLSSVVGHSESVVVGHHQEMIGYHHHHHNVGYGSGSVGGISGGIGSGIESFEKLLLDGYLSVSVKQVQDCSYSYIAYQQQTNVVSGGSSSSIYSVVGSGSGVGSGYGSGSGNNNSYGNRNNLVGVYINRIPFLKFSQLKKSISIIKRQMLLNDLYQSCFIKLNNTTTNNNNNSIWSQAFPSNTTTSYLLNNNNNNYSSLINREINIPLDSKRIEVEYLLPDAIILKTVNEIDQLTFKIQIQENEDDLIEVLLNDEYQLQLTEILNETHQVPLMIHFYFKKLNVVFGQPNIY
ncbi:hypothetical protein ABK040_004186 [Willaertia magna]